MFEFVFRMMAEGDVSLPARGMGAIPQQMAADLPEQRLRFDCEVESIGDGFVVLNSGERIRSSSVLVATDVFVCGDHRDNASIQGALVSGRRAAEAVLAEKN